MKIIYTINGQEGTYSVSGRDRYKLERLMNDGIGIPAEPMTDVLVFAAYMGGYSLYGFYNEIIEEFLNPDELFNTEPIEYFNTVMSPLFEDDVIHILDITEWDMLENKRRSKGMKRVRESEEILSDYISEEELRDEFEGFAQDTAHDFFGNSDFKEEIIDDMAEMFEKGISKGLNTSVSEILDYLGIEMEEFEDDPAPNAVMYIWSATVPSGWDDKLSRKYNEASNGEEDDSDEDEGADYSDEVVDTIAEAAEQVLLDTYAAHGINIPSFDIIQGNSYFFPTVNSYYIRHRISFTNSLVHDGLRPARATVEGVTKALADPNSETYNIIRKHADTLAREGIKNLKQGDARAYFERKGVEVPDNLEEILSNWDTITESSKRRVKESSKRQYRDPMRKVRALREEEEAESEEGTVTFTPDELKFIAGRMFVESEWGASVYDGGSLEIIKSILAKMDEAGIEYK